MPREANNTDRPGEVGGRPQLTREGYAQLAERADDIRESAGCGDAAAPWSRPNGTSGWSRSSSG